MKALAVDYGRARIGVAVQMGSLAEPLEVIPATQDFTGRLRSLCHEHRVDQIVVGVSEQAMAEESKVFGVELERQLKLPVVFQDEALSSIEVQNRLRQSRAGKQQYRGDIDHFAAAVILERYLDDMGEDTV